MQRNRSNCEYRCVRGQSPRPIFVAAKQGGRYLEMCKRQPQLIEGKTSPTSAGDDATLITKDGRLRSFLNGGRVFRLNWTKVRGLE